MPAIQPPAKVLISGATGYIATWIVKDLLERGYAVRGTAKSSAKGDFLEKLFAAYGDRFEIVIVGDVVLEGAFDEAVKDVDAVEHTASPVNSEVTDPDELIRPVLHGTLGILNSILGDETSKVKRVVATSSVSSILRDDPNPITFTEADWDEQCPKILKKFEEDGRKNEAPGRETYRASKTLAERSAWELVNRPDVKSRIEWDLVTLNPSLPAIHEVTTPTALNTSAIAFHHYVADHVKANTVGNKFLANEGGNWVDVRDVARAHVLALEKEAAGGERIIISSGPFKWQDFIDAADDVQPTPELLTRPPVGVRGAGRTAKHLILFDTTKADRIFGLKYRTIAETTRDVLADYEARGW